MAKPLTDRERRFAEAWVADPEHNGPAAARAAGFKGKDASLRVTASRVLTRANVQEHIAALRQAALVHADARTGGTIATLSEALEHATGVMTLDITECLGDDGEPDMNRIRELPPIQRRALAVEVQTTTDEDGQVFARHKLKRDPVALAASKLIVEHHAGIDKPGGGNTYVLDLRGAPPELIRALYQRWLESQPKVLNP